MSITTPLWWGAPKKFSTEIQERKISWLELFYDLVYAALISKTTYNLTQHTNIEGILDYIYLFTMIFWGWFNGSLYHDLHGSPGIRTRLMTMWQMITAAALAVALCSPPDKIIFRATITIAVLQAYITYLWWSVGIYDKEHRRLNIPYTICYLLALALIITTLFVPQPFKRILFSITLVLNYLPQFLFLFRLKDRRGFTLSPSMVERLGLITIIVFGEAILGVINGMSALNEMNWNTWLCFGLGILMVFALWWIFFSLVADRESRKGYLSGIVMSMVYLFTLSSLGMVGASFPGLMHSFGQTAVEHLNFSRSAYGISIAIFLCSIVSISRFLVYSAEQYKTKRGLQSLLMSASVIIILFTFFLQSLSLVQYLLSIFIVLLLIIIAITKIWYQAQIKSFLGDDAEMKESTT